MKGGKQVKLMVSDSSSDIESQIDNNWHHGEKKIRRQISEEEEEDEEAIDDMIRQCQMKNKRNPLKIGIQLQAKVMEREVITKKVQPSISASQTQTIQELKKQKIKNKAEQKLFNPFQYEFNPENKKEAIKNLTTNFHNQNKRGSESNISLTSQFRPPKLTKGRVIEHSLKAAQKQFKLQGIPVYFPYQPYDLQKDYMESVIKAVSERENALLQSPTGTGKTLCLLSSVLSWVDHFNGQSQEKVNVIYCSRTHTQLRQVQSELEKTCFRPTISNFGSRDQFCIKDQFSAIKGRDLMQACSKAVKLYLKAKRKLEIEQQQDQKNQKGDPLDPQDKKQKSHMCYFYKSQNEYQKILQQRYLNKIITSQMIKNQGKQHGFCPYYYAFQIKQRADLIFMPYNYILDVDRIPRYESIIQNSVIIFDEAHNVPEAACQGRSFSIYSNIFGNIDAELKKLEHHPFMSQELKEVSYIFEPTIELLKKQSFYLKGKLDDLAQNVHKRQSSNNEFWFGQQFDIEQIFKPQDLKIMVYNWFGPEHHSPAQFQTLAPVKQKQLHMKTVIHLNRITKETDELIEALKETYDGVFQNLEKLNSFVQKCRDLIIDFQGDSANDWWMKEVNHYRLSVKCNARDGALLYEMKLVCLTPSLTFNDISKYHPRSIILTSGTLTPLDSWQKELNFKFHVKLVNKHVINREQLHLGIVCKSIQNESNFNFSYNELQNNPKIYKNLFKSITKLAQKIPNGLLIIFPSYKVIKNFKDEMQRETQTLNQLRNAKHICFEDKGGIQYLIQNFKSKARTKKGAVLFCVCRGKVSQGLDFADELCRAVMFIGVPYPNVKDPILKQKREYYDKLSQASRSRGLQSLSGDEWYTLSTMRAVNQGIGRVIRHINDYGMILMFDSRYEQSKLRNMLPLWARDGMGVYRDFAEVQNKVGDFYGKMRSKYGEVEAKGKEAESDSMEQNAYLRKPIKKQPKKQIIKPAGSLKNPFEIMMSQAKRNSKGGNQRKSKKKDIDFL